MTAATLDQANATLRAAVKQRLDATPADDPKLVGYPHSPTESCCEGTRMKGDSLLGPTRHPSSTAFIELLGEMQRLHESKSADYGSEDDPLANVRSGADFVNIEPWRGCMVRIADKVQRLRTFCRSGRLVHEGVRDTLLDLAAYSLLAIVLHDEGRDA
jgi:hypothetical protein